MNELKFQNNLDPDGIGGTGCDAGGLLIYSGGRIRTKLAKRGMP